VSVREIRGGVASADGFLAGSATAGLRSRPLPDLALLACADGLASAAAVFTTNRFAAAPIEIARRHLASNGGRIRAVVANAGCANAGTGKAGLQAALRMAAAAAAKLGCKPEEVLPASTGLIGSRLRIDRIEAALAGMKLRRGSPAGAAAARAILTTDTRPKQAAVESAGFVVGGMAKGSGMIHPQMATMLGFVTTDADASPQLLQQVLHHAVERSFNQVSVDGDESTNDMVVLLASGASGVHASADDLADAVTAVCRSLAMQIAADGEGARSRIDVTVTGAPDDAAAVEVAQPLSEHVGADVRQPGPQVGEPLRAEQELAHHEQRPALADDVERPRDPAAIPVGPCHTGQNIKRTCWFFQLQRVRWCP